MRGEPSKRVPEMTREPAGPSRVRVTRLEKAPPWLDLCSSTIRPMRSATRPALTMFTGWSVARSSRAARPLTVRGEQSWWAMAPLKPKLTRSRLPFSNWRPNSARTAMSLK